MTFKRTDFMAGDDVTSTVRRSERPGIVVSVRLDRADADLLFDEAELTGRTISQVAREAIRSHLTARSRWALAASSVSNGEIYTVSPTSAYTRGTPIELMPRPDQSAA